MNFSIIFYGPITALPYKMKNDDKYMMHALYTPTYRHSIVLTFRFCLLGTNYYDWDDMPYSWLDTITIIGPWIEMYYDS